MRKSRYIQLIASTALSALFLFSGSFIANAQNRGHYENGAASKERKKTRKEWNEQHEKRYHHESYDKERWHRNNHKYHGKKHKRGHRDHHSHAHKGHYKSHHKHHHGHKHGNKHGHKHYGYYYSGDRYHSPHRGHYHSPSHRYNRVAHRYYHHPNYGRVIARFGCEPVVIPHRHGNYYYVEGCYYRYYRNVGYVVVEAPRRIYFDELPHGCDHVCHKGGNYYVYGDLCFERHGAGFRLIARPSGLNVSIRF